MKLQGAGQEYTRALRAIGQDLTSLFPENLEIQMSGQDFVACGRSGTGTSIAKKNEQPGMLRNLWHKLSQRSPKAVDIPPQPSSKEFVRTYTPDDINRMDKTGTVHRMDTARTPDLYSLAERLRMIGRIMDENKAELLTLRHDTNTVTFQYRDGQGNIQQEEHSTLALFKLQQRYCSERTLPKDPWQGIDR